MDSISEGFSLKALISEIREDIENSEADLRKTIEKFRCKVRAGLESLARERNVVYDKARRLGGVIRGEDSSKLRMNQCVLCQSANSGEVPYFRAVFNLPDRTLRFSNSDARETIRLIGYESPLMRKKSGGKSPCCDLVGATRDSRIVCIEGKTNPMGKETDIIYALLGGYGYSLCCEYFLSSRYSDDFIGEIALSLRDFHGEQNTSGEKWRASFAVAAPISYFHELLGPTHLAERRLREAGRLLPVLQSFASPEWFGFLAFDCDESGVKPRDPRTISGKEWVEPHFPIEKDSVQIFRDIASMDTKLMRRQPDTSSIRMNRENSGTCLYEHVVSYAASSDSPAPVLGTVVETAGSTPQKAGCQSVLEATGRFLGTLGGGMVEDEAQRLMRAAQADGQPRLFERRLDDEYSRTAGPICGGVMRIFINPTAAEQGDAIRAALDAAATRRRGALITTIASANGALGRIEYMDAPRGGSRSRATVASTMSTPSITQLLSEERPGIAEIAPGTRVFVEPIVPAPRLLIVGGGHVGQAVARQMIGLGFEVSVIDDREEFARAELFPDGVQALRGNIKELVANFPKDPDTYIVLVSKGHRPDAEALEACIHADVAYLGMIGSRRKVRMLRDHFLRDGLASQAEWDRIVAPIGYEIGAVTVPEIAVSIAAQLIAARRSPDAVRRIAVKAK